MKSRNSLKRLAILLFIALCGFVYFFKAGEKEVPVISETPVTTVATSPANEVSERPASFLAKDQRSDTPSLKPKGTKKEEDKKLSENSEIVNINTASLDELCTLTGIGKVKGQRIIDYRKENGPFKDIGEIKNISGIKEGTFKKIKDKITV